MRGKRPRLAGGVVFVALLLLLAATSLWALTVGSSGLGLRDALEALSGPHGSRDYLIMTTVRLPRVLAALLAGAALAMAGAIMQAVTANPLASPGILGINAGAAFAVVISIAFFGTADTASYVWFAFAGAAVAALCVYLLGSAGAAGATPLKLALAGAILSAFLGALTTSILIFDRTTLDDVRMWTVGSLSGRPMSSVTAVAPYFALGLAAAIVSARQLATLSLGTEVARTIGQNVAAWRIAFAAIVVLLAGGAVAMTWPIGFVGLVVPHMVRLVIGANYRWLLPYSAVSGALLVLVADNILRLTASGRDVPVGVTMALVGAPFFIYLARYRTGAMK